LCLRAGEATRGIAEVSISSGIPVIFGVLTTHNMQHALERSGGRKGNAGHSCALTAIETANVLRIV
jgi:6,7-dimethyl-8-ribityllumazine synthase